MAQRPKVVIVGGGFGGLRVARSLARSPVDITLVDRRNHHLFQPLLYQVATAGLSAPNIAAPIRKVLRKQKNVEVLLAEALEVDVAGRRLVLDEGELAYDFLVLAAGARNHYFGKDDWQGFAPGLKSLEDAMDIRRRVLLAFEMAERFPEQAYEWLGFVVIGAGPTGVELAGALMEIARFTVSEDFRHIDTRQARVTLFEGDERVLPAFPPDLSARAQRTLEEMGVVVRTGVRVTEVDGDGVLIGDERVAAHTVLWAAGVRASSLGESLGVELGPGGRVPVGGDMAIEGHPEVFVIGDMAHALSEGEPVPGVAQGAIQAGQHVARCIDATLADKPRPDFVYWDKGTMATIGRKNAVAVVGRLHAGGFLAWLLWLGVHVLFLIDFRNRVAVLTEWTWAYLTFQRSARVVLTDDRPALSERRRRGEHPGEEA